jgi:DNA-binding transcriptional LysR family regulator
MRRLKFEPLREYPMCVAVSPRHPLAKAKAATLKQIAGEPFLAYARAEYPDYHAMIEEVFRPLGVQPRVVEEHDSAPGLIAATEAGRGVSLAASSLAIVAGGRIKLVPLKPAPPALVVGAAYNPKRLAPAARQFLEAAGGLKPGR